MVNVLYLGLLCFVLFLLLFGRGGVGWGLEWIYIYELEVVLFFEITVLFGSNI